MTSYQTKVKEINNIIYIDYYKENIFKGTVLINKKEEC